MAEQEYLGTGMCFPPQIDEATGRFKTSSEKESIRQSVYLILMTQRGERIMRQDFGSLLIDYTFMDVNATNITIMTEDLVHQILSQEPRIGNVDIGVEPDLDNGCLILNIDYYIISENVRDNLVFPFYLNAAGQEQEQNVSENERMDEMEGMEEMSGMEGMEQDDEV